jgi:hypothetical protein
MLMRLILFIPLLFIFYACQEAEQMQLHEEKPSTDTELLAYAEVLTAPVEFVGGLFLPVGTELVPDLERNVVSFELPEGYITLWYDEATKKASIGKSGGTYTCSCSGNGSCTAFVVPGQGPGCLQSDCTKVCSGEVVNDDDAKSSTSPNTLIGILSNNKLLLPGRAKIEAQITWGYEDAFYALPEVSEAITSTYEFAYTHFEKPDFNNISPQNLPADFAIGVVNIYGHELGIVLPNEKESLKELFPEGPIFYGGNDKFGDEFSCSTTAPNCTCESYRKYVLGNYFFSCSGCNPCSITYE